MRMILPPPFPVSLQCPLLPTLSFKNTLEHTKSSQFCSYVHGRGAIHWLRGALPVAMFSLGNSSSVNSLEIIFPTFAGTLTDVISCRFCPGNTGCCEFIYVITMHCLLAFVSFLAHFLQCFPNLDWGQVLEIDAPFMAEHSAFYFSLLASCAALE